MRLWVCSVIVFLIAPLVAAGSAADEPEPLFIWEMRGCSHAYASFDVPMVNAERFVAPGLTPLEGSEPGLARAVVGANRCAAAQVGNVVVPDASYAQVSLVLKEPEGLGRKHVTTGYFQLLDVVVNDETRLDVLMAHGVRATLGEVRHVETPHSATKVTEVDWGDEGTVRLATSGLGTNSPRGGRWVDFAPSSANVLLGFQVDWLSETVSLGAGYVAAEPGSLHQDLFGAPAVPAQLTAGVWSYEPGFAYAAR